MRWSLKLGKVAGMGLYVHATFCLLIAWIALRDWLRTRDGAATAEGVVFVVALFLCVALHELMHALMARQYGIRTRDITLLRFGGLARLERVPEGGFPSPLTRLYSSGLPCHTPFYSRVETSLLRV